MKFLSLILVSTLLLEQSSAFPFTPNGASVASPVLKKRARDCGTWKMKCKNAAGACNNACYFVKCVNKNNSKFVSGGDKPPAQDNRVHSGCTTSLSTSTCKAPPFSQRFYDQVPDAKSLSCDEFPMADFKQNEFKDGEYRNSLRCIEETENSSGGSQFNIFKKAQGDWKPGGKFEKDRTCGTDDLQDGDTFSVDWIIDGDDGFKDDAERRQKVPYCMPNPSCNNDGFQFHMTKLVKTGEKGKLGNPYDYNDNNRYALDGAGDIRLYGIVIKRSGSEEFVIEVSEINGKESKSKAKFTEKIGKDHWFTTDKALPRQVLSIGSTGDPGTDVIFQAKQINALDFSKGDFTWKSSQTGVAGQYCGRTSSDTVPKQETISCTFPVLA